MIVRLRNNILLKSILFSCVLLQVSCKSVESSKLRDFGGFRLYYDKELTEDEMALFSNLEDVMVDVSGAVRVGSTNEKVLKGTLIEFLGKTPEGVDIIYKTRTDIDGNYKLRILPTGEYIVTIYAVENGLVASNVYLGYIHKKARLDLFVVKIQ